MPVATIYYQLLAKPNIQNTEKTIIENKRNPDPGLGQTQKCCISKVSQ
jgi:hypothetical protein